MPAWPPKPEIFKFLETWHIPSKFQRQIWGFRPRRVRRNCLQTIATTMTTGTGNIDVLGTNLAISGCPPLSQSLYRVRHVRKCRICRWNFDAVCHSSRNISIFIFPVSAAISGCRSLLESLRDSLFKLVVVDNLRFAVKILMIYVILSEI